MFIQNYRTNCPFSLPQYQFGFSSKEERKRRKKACIKIAFFSFSNLYVTTQGPDLEFLFRAQVSPAEKPQELNSVSLPWTKKETWNPKRRCSDLQRHHWGREEGGGKAAIFLGQLHKICFQLWSGCREGKVLTGWSASKSDPYISTRFAHLSKSEIFFGNQGTFSMSREGMESTRLLITPSTPSEEMLLSAMAMVVTAHCIN